MQSATGILKPRIVGTLIVLHPATAKIIMSPRAWLWPHSWQCRSVVSCSHPMDGYAPTEVTISDVVTNPTD